MIKGINESLVAPFRELFSLNDYRWHNEPMKLNIIGVRTENTKAGRFDDWLYLFYKDDQKRQRLVQYPCTVDSGVYGLTNPVHADGCGIVCPQQYALEIRKHRGEYNALCQASNVHVYRDNNRDKVINFDASTIMQMTPEEGGFNLHKKKHSHEEIKHSSYGCTVTYAPYFDEIMTLAYEHRNRYGNVFDYTLLSDIFIDRFQCNQFYSEAEKALALTKSVRI
jgi:hypothetical protein